MGFVYVAFVIDIFARNPDPNTLKHHTDRGVQCLVIKYTERLEEAKIEPSVASVRDSYDNAMAATIKSTVIVHERPWSGKGDVEFSMLQWGDGVNINHLFGLLSKLNSC